MICPPEQATVYRAINGRRYLSRRSALIKTAMVLLKKKHGMDGCHDELRGGEHYQEEFYTNEQMERFTAVAKRYARRATTAAKGKQDV